MSKTTKHIILEDAAYDYSDVLVASDGYLWVAGKRYLPYANILPAPYTSNRAYSTGTVPIKTIELGALAADVVGNGVSYKLTITETNPFTGNKYSESKSYKTSASGSPDTEDVMAQFITQFAASTHFTVADGGDNNILAVTGTVAGGDLTLDMTCDSIDGLNTTVLTSQAYVAPVGNAAHIGHFADTLGLTFAGSAYNVITIKGTASSGESLNSPVNQMQEFVFWILDSTMDNLYNEFVNVLQADSAYTPYGELIAKLPQ